MKQEKNAAFRPDINGLRAWAVVAVVLYHFGIPYFGGGFVGVDVFFVISGYLMTRIICTGLERGSFGLWQFYVARGRRIIPTLLVLCAALLIGGWWFLFPFEYESLGAATGAALFFVSNVHLWQSAGYFDTASHQKWLLHTWSLAVEWQFYLLLPIVLWGIWRVKLKRYVFLIIVFAVVASLTWSVITTQAHPVLAFYSLPTRAWELLIGGLVFLSEGYGLIKRLQAWGRAVEAVGLILISASVYGYSTGTPWPSAWAAAPVLGAALVLMAARPASIWTGNRAAQWLGTTSYSLYLWHWPLAVLLNYLSWEHNPWAIAAALAGSVLLGYLSWRWVEEPTHHIKGWSTGKTAGLLLAATLLVFAGAAVVKLKRGIEGRMPKQLNAMLQQALATNSRREECLKATMPAPECRYGGTKLGVIVMGDSHAAAVVRAVTNTLPSKDLYTLDWSLIGCATMAGMHTNFPDRNGCPFFVPYALEKQKTLDPNVPVLIVNRLSLYFYGETNETGQNLSIYYFGDRPMHYAELGSSLIKDFKPALVHAACELAKTRPVYMLRPIPEMPVDVARVGIRSLYWTGRLPDISISLDEYHRREALAWQVQDEAAAQCGVKILDPLPYLCWGGRCHGMKDGHVLYYDNNHLDETGAALLQPLFAQMFKK